jgi:FtsH-binding integral membrane protein
MQDNNFNSQPIIGQNQYSGYGGGNPYYNNQNNNLYNNYEPKLDIEQGGLESGDAVKKMMRLGFIRKVYGILSIQLAITVGFMSLAFIESFKLFLKSHMALFWIAMALSLVIIIPLVCFKQLARGFPQNYILLFLWTLCESYMLATAVSFYDAQIVMLAGVLTASVTISLTIYACTTKTDFTFCGGFLFCCVTILFVWGIFSCIFGFVSNTLYCVLGLIVYSIYLIYDTQLVMGKFGSEFDIDDYVYAALNIYIDIIQIFLYILQLLAKK